MSTGAAPITLRESHWQSVPDEIVIGKDILELVSSSMYVEPMTVYREYMQNAADAIDEARAAGLMRSDECGKVNIRVDTATRVVTIRDNGPGIEHQEFAKRLTAFGASKKRGRGARGFRGVGRLAGIGYCQELIFRTRSAGEAKLSEMRWDCRRLKAMLRSTEEHSDLREAVAQLVELRRVSASNFPEQFFEVEMRGIIRHRNDQLLNASAIKDYLAQVAPVPFHTSFPYADRILKHLEPLVQTGNLEIYVGDDSNPVKRPHRDGLDLGGGTVDPFTDVELFSVENIDGGTACLGWVLHHSYLGALPAGSNVRGLRIRSGNIQVGNERLFEELFPEPRFNSWCVGEIHVVDSRFVPNGRRDHFEQSVHFDNLLTHLAPITRDIARRCRTGSMRRKWTRDFDLRESAIREKAAIIRQGTLGRNDTQRIVEQITAGIAFLESITKKNILTADLVCELKKRKEKVEKDVTKILKSPVRAAAFSAIPSSKRRAYEQMISLIYECSASQANAKLLVDKILSRLSST
jgi:Histidine kinase-, DNA gyrase B-, and HSP90-like ATPase